MAIRVVFVFVRIFDIEHLGKDTGSVGRPRSFSHFYFLKSSSGVVQADHLLHIRVVYGVVYNMA